MKIYMKLRKQQFKKYKIVLLCLGCLLIIITLAFYVKYIIEKNNMVEKYRIISPSNIYISNENLITKVYFNNLPGEEVALDPIVEVIENAKHSLEIAIFSIDSNKIKRAIYNAANKGIKITLILDASRGQKNDVKFGDLPDTIKRIDLGKFNPNISTETVYMHHKLIISDRGFESEKIVTGSIDYTNKGEMYEQSFFLITSDKLIAKIYEEEMDFLKNGFSGKNKLKQLEYNPWASHIEYPDSYLDIWFSPGFDENSVKYRILQEISKAKKIINIIMWQFTDKMIADALIDKAKEGIPIKIITEDLVANNISSSIPYLKNIIAHDNLNNIEIILDTKSNEKIDLTKLSPGFSSFIHHHFMTVDKETLIFGTNNWSTWGFYKNDEDTLITNNKYLIGEFENTFDYFYKTLK
jgi:phosphatidylserine/phosphatidylglycerophosphate/cardiolipin synthase-like enzyme